MKVWTIQPKEVLDEINNKGVYVCDPDKSEISDGMVLDYFKFGYDWIVSEMDKRIQEALETANDEVKGLIAGVDSATGREELLDIIAGNTPPNNS